MALLDDVQIVVKAGSGGNGGKSFHTEYGSMKRKPDGGNGGYGGNVYFEGTTNVNDFSEFRFRKEIKAHNGENGRHKDLDGKKGKDVTVMVPLGTTVIDEDTGEQVEILEKGEVILVARGGRGGIGTHDQILDEKTYRLSVDKGELGEEKKLHLILNLIADVGLVGYPNAGKSSLLSILTNATPKIGDYAFTTLEPNLGVINGITIADIPGVIEGASEGRGLGLQFLKHINKTKLLLHCIDASIENLYESYTTIQKEFEEYSKELVAKEEIIVLTKIDLIDDEKLKKQIANLKKTKKEIIPVSIYDEKSIETLKEKLHTHFRTS